MEKKCKQVRLVSEVIASQNGSSEESDSMDLISVDFSLKTVENVSISMQKPTNYMYVLSRFIRSTCDIKDLFNALKLLKKEKLSLYRLKNGKRKQY